MRVRDAKSLRRHLQTYFEARPEVQAGYLFGSFAMGRPRPDSDIDVAALIEDEVFREDTLRYKIDRIGELTEILGTDAVDLVILNEAPPLLAHRVLSKGVLVFERSPSARVQFQVRTVNRYLDTQPLRDLYLSYLQKHAREGRILGR